MNNEQMMQLQMIEQESQQLEQQLQMIEQHLKEIQEINIGLNEIAEGKEILANMGKRIYIPAVIKDTNLIVEIGNKKYVKKTIPETQKIIEEQIIKLNSGKEQILVRIEELSLEMSQVIGESKN